MKCSVLNLTKEKYVKKGRAWKKLGASALVSGSRHDLYESGILSASSGRGGEFPRNASGMALVAWTTTTASSFQFHLYGILTFGDQRTEAGRFISYSIWSRDYLDWTSTLCNMYRAKSDFAIVAVFFIHIFLHPEIQMHTTSGTKLIYKYILLAWISFIPFRPRTTEIHA